jgi:putative transposase
LGKEVTLGYKYRIYPNKEQKSLLEYQMFIYNQSYNICLNLLQKEWESNKVLDKKDRIYMKASEIDTKVKEALKKRDLSYKTVVTQQARINCQKALKNAISIKDRGFPKFKNSKIAKQSFNWNNQGYQILDSDSKRYKILRLMSQNIKLRYHRELPKVYKMNAITVSKSGNKYFVSFSITYKKIVSLVTKDNLDTKKAIGIDLNINDIALSNNRLIQTDSKEYAKDKYSKAFQRLQKKQSRSVLKSIRTKTKLGANFKKRQNKINKIFEKAKNRKDDKYHKITSELAQKFNMVVVEDLNTKNMTKRAKEKKVKQKSGLNKSILNTSFYQIINQIEYKTMLNGKLFVKVPPQYTSKTCSVCGQINNNLKLSDRVYSCDCGAIINRDINASVNILRKGLESFGLGTNLVDSKHKAFRSSSLEFVS